MRAKPRSKGNRAEREIIDLLNSYGYSTRRNFQSGGQGGGDILGFDGHHVEVKHRESCAIFTWIEQAESEARPTDTPLVVFRCNGEKWYVCLREDDFAFGELPPTLVKTYEARSCAIWRWIREARDEAGERLSLVRFRRIVAETGRNADGEWRLILPFTSYVELVRSDERARKMQGFRGLTA